MRLIVFGCSFAAGNGNVDLWNAEKQKSIRGTSKYSWPAQLGRMLDVEVVNMAKPGCSNKYIAYTAQNFDYQPTDQVLLAWTFLQRSCIIDYPTIRHDHYHYHLSVHESPSDQPVSYSWREHHTTYNNLLFDTTMAIGSTAYYLKQHNVKFNHLFHTDLQQTPDFDLFIEDTLPVWFDWKDGERGFDGRHPNQETYTKYAKNIYNVYAK